MTQRCCSKCGTEKLATEFYICRGQLRPDCKACVKTHVAKRYAENKNSINSAKRARYKSDPEYRRVINERDAVRRAKPENREKAKRTTVSWNKDPAKAPIIKARRARPENRKKATEKRSKWQKEHPEAVAAQKAKRHALKAAASGSHTKEEVSDLLVRQHHLCANPVCMIDLRQSPKHLDHRKPLSKGGSNDIKNLQWLCAPCNIRKRDKDPDEWLRQEMAA